MAETQSPKPSEAIDALKRSTFEMSNIYMRTMKLHRPIDVDLLHLRHQNDLFPIQVASLVRETDILRGLKVAFDRMGAKGLPFVAIGISRYIPDADLASSSLRSFTHVRSSDRLTIGFLRPLEICCCRHDGETTHQTIDAGENLTYDMLERVTSFLEDYNEDPTAHVLLRMMPPAVNFRLET